VAGEAKDAAPAAVGEVMARLLADGDFGRIPQLAREASESVKPPVARRPTASLTAPAPPALRELVVEYTPHTHGGLLLVTSATDRGDSTAALKPVLDAFTSLRKEGVTLAELDYARRRALGAHLFAVETYAGQASALGEAEMTGSYLAAVERTDRLMKVSQADLEEFARKWFDPAKIGRASVTGRHAR
jgi:hypothetical protein